MLKKDKNGFIEIIKANDLAPSLFRTYEKEIENHPAFILRLENTPLFFMARTAIDNYHKHDCRHIKFAPNYPKSDYYPNSSYQNWFNIESVFDYFEHWLKEHVKVYLEEIETPDLWNQFHGSSITQIEFGSPEARTTFNKSEKIQIRNALEHFQKELITKYQPTKEQIHAINTRLSYLSDKLDDLNRIDWQGAALSTVIGISIALNLDTEKGKVLFSMFKEAFKHALSLLQ